MGFTIDLVVANDVAHAHERFENKNCMFLGRLSF
jgi:hypothetical protein